MKRGSGTADRLIAALLIAAAALVPTLPAAEPTGHRYWLAFAENYGDDIRLSLSINAEQPTAVDIEIVGLRFRAQVQATPGKTVEVELPIEAMVRAGKPTALGVQVAAAQPLTVVGLSHRPNSTDAFLALPQRALGTRYRGLSYPQTRTDLPSQLLVLATADGTDLKMDAHGQCPATALRLNRGQTWLQTCEDVSGQTVQASRPVAVFGGARCAEVPTGAEFCSHLAEQLPPVELWGRTFPVVPLATRKGSDRIRIVADRDDTEIRVDGMLVATLPAGGLHQLTLAKAVLIDTSQPALVAQFAAGQSVDRVDADPFMALVPAVEHYAVRQTVNAPEPVANPDRPPTPTFVGHHVTVTLPKAVAASLRLDGQPVARTAFEAIGDGRYVGAQLGLAVGTHRLEADAPFGAVVYGFAYAESYGYSTLPTLPQALAPIDAAGP